MTRLWRELRYAVDDWKRIRRIRMYQETRDALSDNLPRVWNQW